MKTLFTTVALLFIGIVASVYIAGSISRDNRLMRENYTKQLHDKITALSSAVDISNQTLEKLNNDFVSAQSETKTTSSKSTSKTKQKVEVTSTKSSGTKLTLDEVAKHAVPSNCWIVVSGKVYSVGGYITMHPGGKNAITSLCGKDATTAFITRGGTGKHSDSSWTLLGSFLIGALGASVAL